MNIAELIEKYEKVKREAELAATECKGYRQIIEGQMLLKFLDTLLADMREVEKSIAEELRYR